MNNIPCDTIPVRTLTHKDPKSGEERFEAICRFVNILTPQEIKGLTKFYAETWTLAEWEHEVDQEDDIFLGVYEYQYDIIYKGDWYGKLPKETKLHLSFRYKYQKFAYVLVSLAPTT